MFFIRILSRLPLSVLYGLSSFLFVLTYYIVGYRRKLVKKNIRNSFREKSKKERTEIVRDFYRNLCDYAVETIKLLSIDQADLGRRVIFKNTEKLEEYKAANQSVILLASHQFNWEWLVAAGNFSLPVHVDFVYQPVGNKTFDHFLLSCRSRFGAYPISRYDVAREVVKRKNILRGIAIVADQYPGLKKDKKFIVDFLHQKTAFFYGANQLATLTKYPVMFAAVEKVKRGFYEVSLVSIAEPPYERDSPVIVERYAKAAEKVIQQYPSGWLWSHNRWKKRHLTQASEIYPPASTAS